MFCVLGTRPGRIIPLLTHQPPRPQRIYVLEARVRADRRAGTRKRAGGPGFLYQIRLQVHSLEAKVPGPPVRLRACAQRCTSSSG